METSNTISELAKAVSGMQSQLKSIPKNSNNPFFKSKYADLDAIWDGVRKPLTDNGLAVIQSIDKINNELTLVTTLVHTSGEWINSYIPVNAKASDPQSVGSAITYARRYSLSAILGVSADEDDDAEQAMARDKSKEKPVVISKKETTTEKPKVTPAQVKRLWALAKSKNITEDQIHNFIKKRYNKDSVNDLTVPEYDELCTMIEKANKKEEGKD